VYLALLLAPTGAVAWLLAALAPSRRLARLLEHGYCRLALKAAGFSVEATGQQQLEQAGALIFACNHASYADIPALLAWLPRRFAFVAKREVRNWPLIGTFVRRAGHLTVERWQAAQSAADSEQIRAAVESGDSVLVFPEGTFTAAAGLRPFRLGAFKAAVETGTAIVPLALGGTRGILRDGAWIPRPARVRLWIGAPMRPTGRDWAAVVELRDRVASAIAAECGEPRLDLLAGAPPRPAP
jgi:1-acyl-sn-glycerol-3-phosphate acyltransferase